MNKLSLLIMAAGMGSRYGGLKQLDIVGPNGETIIDYSVYDAIKIGFSEIIFVIRRDLEDQFKKIISNKYSNIISVKYVYQDINDIPSKYRLPKERIKPWGTGHAILSAKKIINHPFVVINADDFYGRESFQLIQKYYNDKNNHFCMVAYRLDKTLSKNGSVSRGVCTLDNNKLISVEEIKSIEFRNDNIFSNSNIQLNGDESVSMNMWGFTPKIFEYLEKGFIEFLDMNINNNKSEFLIPTLVNNLLDNNKEQIHTLKSNGDWFGVTYKEDRSLVIDSIQSMINNNIYNSPLF